METITSRLRQPVKFKTPYQEIAEKFKVGTFYVGQIARGERTPVRGKGLKVLKEIEKLINNKQNENTSKISTKNTEV